MNLQYLMIMLRTPDLAGLARAMRESLHYVRMHYLHAALDCGLIEALRRPRTREELLGLLNVRRPQFLDGLLELGLSLKELKCKRGEFSIKGGLSRSLLGPQGGVLGAMIQANATYYNSVYRHAAERMRGAPLGDYLPQIGPLVAKFSEVSEPFLRRFLRANLAGRKTPRILDLGCGAGFGLRGAHQANPEAEGVGVEMDPAVARQAEENLTSWGLGSRFRVAVGDLRDILEGLPGPFDLITMINLVYYFTEEERRGLFARLRPLLAPGGALALASNFGSQGRDPMAANLNLATCSIKDCTPLPRLGDLCAQLEQSGYTQVKSTRIVPGSAYYAVTAS